MALEQHGISVTGWKQYEFDDDVNAITDYIENQRPKIPQYPALQGVIDDYEHWLTNLSWSEKYLTPDVSKGEAVFYRDKVNQILGEVLPADIIPGDIKKKIISQDPSTAPSMLVSLLKQLIPESLISTVKWTAFGAVVILSGGAIIYLFGPTIRAVANRKYLNPPQSNDIIKELKP